MMTDETTIPPTLVAHNGKLTNIYLLKPEIGLKHATRIKNRRIKTFQARGRARCKAEATYYASQADYYVARILELHFKAAPNALPKPAVRERLDNIRQLYVQAYGFARDAWACVDDGDFDGASNNRYKAKAAYEKAVNELERFNA